MRLILHIGTDKTGSTAIQKHLYINRQWLLSRSVYIPLTGLGKDNGHGDLLASREPTRMAEMAGELAAAAAQGYEIAVISWEGMSFMQPQEVRRLVTGLCFENIWLLVYLREQADIVQTGYLQEIKTTRSPFDIHDFQCLPVKPSSVRAMLSCYSPARNYSRLLRRWMRFIKQGRVIVREFQRELLVNQNVVDDFLSIMNLEPDSEFKRSDDVSNLSLDVESAIIMNHFDRQKEGDMARKATVYSLLSLIHSEGFGARYFLSSRRVSSIRRFFRRSNQAIGRITGASVPQLFSNLPECSRSYTSASMIASVSSRRQKLIDLQETPMLFASRVPHNRPTQRLLASGWKALEDWGVWSSGKTSTLHFRVPFWMASHGRANLVIFLKGRYLGRNTRSRIVANDMDFGWVDLSKFTRSVVLPITALRENQRVVVQIHHEFPQPAADPDLLDREDNASFGLERFGIQFANPE